MSKLLSLVPGLILTLSVIFSTNANASEYDAQRLFDASGVGEYYSSYFTAAKSAVDSNVESKGHQYYLDQFNEEVLDAFAKLEEGDRRFLSDWFETPLGMKVRDIHSQPINATLAYQHPEKELAESRLRLIQQLITSAKTVEYTINISDALSNSYALSVNSYIDKETRKVQDEFREARSRYTEEMKEFYRIAAISRASIAYKELSEDELLQLIQQVETSPYHQFFQISLDAMTDVMAMLFYDNGAAMAKSFMEARERLEQQQSKVNKRFKGGSCKAPRDHGINNENLLSD